MLTLKNRKTMKRYIIFGFSLLMAFPASVFAQDDEQDDETYEAPVRTIPVKLKKYETRPVSGLVIDASTQKPVAGAIVRAAELEGYSVLTEDDGTYSLNVPVFCSALLVTTPDHNPVRIGLVLDSQQRTVLLYPSTFDADYAAQTNVRGDRLATDFKYTNAVNIKDEIQKQLGGYVHTVGRNGTPGVGSVMFMQGLNSLNVNAQPLVVVDDVIIDQQYGRNLLHEGFYNDILTNINPLDIEKVTVVRNGTALYGAKGANGVILIQTRRNKSMATRITANVSAGVTFEPKFVSVMDAGQYRSYASELLKTTNTTNRKFKFLNEDPTYYYYDQYHQNTDWADYVYRTAISQNYGINVEGGDNVANYNLSVGYGNVQSTLKNNGMGRLNVRFNTDISLSSKLDVRFDASFSNVTRNLRNDGAPVGYDEGTPSAPSFLAYVKAPFMSPYSYGHDENGIGRFSSSKFDIAQESYLSEALAKYTNYNWRLGNPAAILDYSEAENKNRFENSMLNLTITPKYQITRNLFASEHFSYNLVNTNEMFYIPLSGTPSYYVESLGGYRNNEVRSLASKQNSVMSDTRLDWSNRYYAHYFHIFGGARINWESFTSSAALSYNTSSDKQPFHTSNDHQVVGTNENWNSLAWYAQAEYNYKSRYYLQANFTMEGSSRFGQDGGDIRLLKAPWALFPGVQAAWVISNEPWMAGVKGIDYLRLSAGFELSGNDDIDYYASRSYFRSQQYLKSVSGLAFEGIGNTKIQWETTRRLNIGLESSVFGDRLAFNVNYFRSTTNNLLTRQSLGYLSGLSSNWSNGGQLKNEGFDVSFTAKVLALKDWQWQVGASAGHYMNKLTELPEGQQFVDTQIYGATIRSQVGQSVNGFYGYKSLGVFANEEEARAAGKGGEKLYFLDANGLDKNYFEAGDMHFADLNGDGQITEADQMLIGDPNPDIYGNIFTTISWKRLKLDVRFNYSLGNDVYNYLRSQLEGGSRFMNQTTAMLRRWQVEDQHTDVPRITFQDPLGNARFSNRWIEDGSYIRLKSATLSYDLPVNSEYIQGFQFWIQGNNLLTFTKYLGSDPEFTMTSSVIGQVIDLGRLGMGRSVVAGVKINL